MQVLASDLIARAKAHTDTDEVAVQQWISDTNWLYWMNREYLRVWKANLRTGLLQIEPSVTTHDAATSPQPWTVSNAQGAPLAIIGVTEETGDTRRVLRASQPGDGWVTLPGISNRSGTATTWSAYHMPLDDDPVIVRTNPVPASGTYKIYWVPPPLAVTATTDVLKLLPGWDERIVLGMARSAFARGSQMPPSIERMIQEYDQEVELSGQLATQRNGVRVKNMDRELRGWSRKGQDVGPPWDVDLWWWV